MQVDVYYSGDSGTKRILIVPAGTDDSDLNGLKPFAFDVGAYLFGANPDDVRDQIQAKGFAICGLPGEVDQTVH